MANEKSTPKFAPPYVSFGIFLKTIETFSSTTVPTGPIDRRVLNDLSGGDYGALMTALRFLDLVDDDRIATADYRKLVELWRDNDKFKEFFLELLTAKYHKIIGKVNLKTGTSAELEKAFKDYGVTAGQMLTKTVRFFLKANTEAGVTLSPYLTTSKPRTPSAPRNGSERGRPRARAQQRESSSSDEQGVPDGFERLPLPGMPNSFIQYPVNLTEAHCQILEAMIGVLRKSVEARTGGKERKP